MKTAVFEINNEIKILSTIDESKLDETMQKQYKDVKYIIVVSSSLPSEDQSTWEIKGKKVVVNVEKLKEYQKSLIPIELTAYQARMALLEFGLLEQVESAMPNLDKAVQIAWEHALTFKRDHAFIQSLISEFGITGEQLDAMFIAGAKYE